MHRARFAGRVWPRGRRPFESAEPLARGDYRTSAREGCQGRPRRVAPRPDQRATVRTTPDISFVARRAAVGDRRDSASTRSMTSWSGRPPSRSNSRRIVESGIRPSRLERALQLARLELRDEPDRPVEQPDEDEERRQPVAQRGQLGVVGMRVERGGGLALLRLEDGDDRVALADLALGDDPPEPLPVVADREIGRAGRPAPADPPRLRDALDDAPRLGLGQGQAGGPVAEAERLADLALGERLLAGHQVGLDPGDRRGDAPGGAHLAPRLGELEPDRLGGLRRRSDAGRAGRSTDRRRRGRNMRLDSSVFIAHNLL